MFNRGRARLRYRIAQAMTIYGLIALAGAVPLFILTWGRPDGSWALIYFLSGLVGLAGATTLGALNLIYIRRSAGSLQSSRDVK